MANRIKDAIKRKLVTPSQMRWNSYYDSITSLLTVLEDPNHRYAINGFMVKEKRTPFNDVDIMVSLNAFITDRVSESLYCFQMNVVANANFDDFSIGEHVLAHSEPYAKFYLFSFCLSVCLCVCLSVC